MHHLSSLLSFCEPGTYGIDFESSVSEVDDDYSIVFPENQIQLTE